MSDGNWLFEQTLKMAQLQREIDNRESLRKANDIAQQQLRESQLQTRLLRKQRLAEQAADEAVNTRSHEQAAAYAANALRIAEQERQIAERTRQAADAEQSRFAALAKLFIDSLCCVAVGDKQLSQAEVDHIVDVLHGLGNDKDKASLQAHITEASKRIHRTGVKAYSMAICQLLVEFATQGVLVFLLDTLKKLAGADGLVSDDEVEILAIFHEQLSSAAQIKPAPLYSDTDVAQTPPQL